MMMRRIVLAAVIVAAASCAAPSAPPTPTPPPVPTPEFINLVDPWPFPFSSAVRAGHLLFLSGQIGTQVIDGAPKLVAGGMEAEARQAMENIKAVLAKAGSSLERVVKCSVMLADMKEWPAFNTVYATYFPGKKPARSAWGANGLALGARVEVECIALAAQ